MVRGLASAVLSCPNDRLTISAGPTTMVPAPPPDIAADPERRGIWEKTHFPKLHGVYQAQGCGQARTVECCGGQCQVMIPPAPPSAPGSPPAPPAPDLLSACH
jgi:hypothetical protein